MSGEQMAVHRDREQVTARQSMAHGLRCLECGKASSGSARGWRALLGGGYEGEDPEIGVYCPDCFGREFGDD